MTASKRYGTTSTILAHPTAVQLLVDLVPYSVLLSRCATGCSEHTVVVQLLVDLVDASGNCFSLSGWVSYAQTFPSGRSVPHDTLMGVALV